MVMIMNNANNDNTITIHNDIYSTRADPRMSAARSRLLLRTVRTRNNVYIYIYTHMYVYTYIYIYIYIYI